MQELPPLSLIHQCLLSSRRPQDGGLTSGMVQPERYNQCMRESGWRSDSRDADDQAAS